MSTAREGVTRVSTCRASDSLSKAAGLMWELEIGRLTVVDDDGCPVATITDRDICMSSYRSGRPLWGLAVQEVIAREWPKASAQVGALEFARARALAPTVISSGNGPGVSASGWSMQGDLNTPTTDVPVHGLLKLFETSRANGVLRVLANGHVGRIYLRRGQVCYASVDGDPKPGPRRSLFRIMAWRTGSFELLPPDGQEFRDELQESTEALLLQGLCEVRAQRGD